MAGIVNAAMPAQQELTMDNRGKVVTAYFDQTSTAYFRPPQLILSSPPSAVSVMQPGHYIRPAVQPTTISFLPQPSLQYDPARPLQIIRAVQRGKHIPILRMASDFNFDGTFNYA